jgi:hypothetical protein
MKENYSLAGLEDYARDCINAGEYPEYNHYFTLFSCNSCGAGKLAITVEHHTGSKDYNFKGIIWGECRECGYLGRLFTFTGEHRKPIRDDRPECDCGSRSFSAGMCERYEGETGIPGYFDEGVIAGKCTECGLNRVFAYTD